VIAATPGAFARAPTLARVVLALLVAAAVFALFYDQTLKREPPLVNRHGGHTRFQPDGPGVREAHFHLEVTVVDALDISVLSARTGRAVAVIARHRRPREYRLFKLEWDGRTAAGTLAPAGAYLVAVHFERGGETVVVPDLELHLEGRSP
jgi:hypothetical protein